MIATLCPFCDPEPIRVIKRGDDYISLLSNPRLVAGHALVVPKLHVKQLHDVSYSIRFDMFVEAMRLARLIVTRGLGTGYEIRIKYEPNLDDGPVHVSHLHIHVVPRNEGDGLFGATETGRELDAFRALPALERDEMKMALA